MEDTYSNINVILIWLNTQASAYECSQTLFTCPELLEFGLHCLSITRVLL